MPVAEPALKTQSVSNANASLTVTTTAHSRPTHLTRVSVVYRDNADALVAVSKDVTVTIVDAADPLHNIPLPTISLVSASSGMLLADDVEILEGETVQVVAPAGGAGNKAYVTIVER